MKNRMEHRTSFMQALSDRFPGGVMAYRDDEKKEIVYGNQELYCILGCRNEEEFLTLTGGRLPGLLKRDDTAVEKDMADQMRVSGGRFSLTCSLLQEMEAGGRWIWWVRGEGTRQEIRWSSFCDGAG